MSHWMILPIVLPASMAGLLVLALRHDLLLQRVASIGSAALLLAISIGLLARASTGAIDVYALGDWPAPFGIVLVLDRLSAMMVVLTNLLALLVLLYALAGWDRRGQHFHALFQFQLMGLNGAFLTGDVFNLFVFFEVLLIASYGLMLHGAGTARLKAGLHYVVVNLTGSALFLVAVGLIYGVTGTLNMADLAVRIPAVPDSDQAILRTGGVLLLLVFGVKAALVPLHFWLPGTYAATSAPVAALFAIMTKVGAYSIIRFHTLAFGGNAGEAAWLAGPWLLPLALATLVLGVTGALAARSLRWLAGFAVVGSMGTLLVAVAVLTPPAMAAALYYLIHSTLIAAALFLLIELVAERRGAVGDRLEPAPGPAQADLMAALFFAAAIAMAGMPPLSGFIGKLLILDGVRAAQAAPVIWAAILITSLLLIIALARAGSLLFWRARSCAATAESERIAARHWPVLPVVVVASLLAATALLTLLAAPVTRYLEAATAQIMEPTDYIMAVLGTKLPASAPELPPVPAPLPTTEAVIDATQIAGWPALAE